MSTLHTNHNASLASLYRIGSLAALLQLAAVITLIIVTSTLGLKPETAEEYFRIYQENKLVGFLRDDFLSLLLIALYLGTFPALYAALRRVSPIYSALASLFTFIGVAVAFSIHSGFSMMYLSEQYAAASTTLEQSRLLAAGQAVIASDMWHGSGAYAAGILLQGAGMMISAVMLRSRDFSKITAWAGLLGNGLDLLQHLLHPFAPSISAVLMVVMGPFYLAWFVMLGRDFLRLARNVSKEVVTRKGV
jgi:hypothetical protein